MSEREQFEAWWKTTGRALCGCSLVPDHSSPNQVMAARGFGAGFAAGFEAARAQPAQAGQVPELTSTEVNDACWAFVEALPHQLPGAIFNDLKPAIYAAICKYLEQAVLAKRVPHWRDIETAPKDGTRVLLVIDHGEWGDAVWTGLWADGWMVSYGKAQAAPTHWMPLPPPPGIVGEKGGA